MKRYLSAAIAAALTIAEPMPILAASPNQHSKMFLFQTSQGVFANGEVVNGSSAKLTRSEHAIWLSINTTNLPAGAYTVWWVIFNNPEACDGPCDDPDLFKPAVQAGGFWATGGVVDANGVGHFRAHLEEGELPALPGQVELPGSSPLLDAQKAQVLVLLRYHGPVLPSILTRQTTTGFGGCIGGPPGQPPPPDPDPMLRLYPCYEPQGALFPSPSR
jgi:hypothetical protein